MVSEKIVRIIFTPRFGIRPTESNRHFWLANKEIPSRQQIFATCIGCGSASVTAIHCQFDDVCFESHTVIQCDSEHGCGARVELLGIVKTYGELLKLAGDFYDRSTKVPLLMPARMMA